MREHPVQEEAHMLAGLESLGIDAVNLLVQLFAFAVFIGIFWKFALGPITNMLDQRQEKIRESMEAAERMEHELASAQARNEEILVEARQEAQGIVASARENSEQLLARSREQAEKQATDLVERARQSIESERQQAWTELRQDVADLAIAAATKIVRKEIDRAEQTRLIQETLMEADRGKAGSQPQA